MKLRATCCYWIFMSFWHVTDEWIPVALECDFKNRPITTKVKKHQSQSYTEWWKNKISKLSLNHVNLLAPNFNLIWETPWDFFGVLRGRNSAPFPMGFRWPFSQFEKKIPNLKKKKIFFFFFFRIFTHTYTHTHKLHNDNLLELHPIFLQFNGNSMCNS